MTTITVTATDEDQETPAPQEQLVLRLRAQPAQPAQRAPPSPPHVTWAADVVDNEHMGRLKSNCCCIYVAPRRWDDPSTWEPDEHETEHCRGHTLPEKKKPKKEDEDRDEDKENKAVENHGCGCDHC